MESLKKYSARLKICKTKGHLYDSETEHTITNSGMSHINGTCKRCNLPYERGLTLEEKKELKKSLGTIVSYP